MLLLISGGFIPSDKGAVGGGGAVSKKLFSLLRASVWSEHKGGGGGGRVCRAPPLDPPLLMARLKP